MGCNRGVAIAPVVAWPQGDGSRQCSFDDTFPARIPLDEVAGHGAPLTNDKPKNQIHRMNTPTHRRAASCSALAACLLLAAATVTAQDHERAGRFYVTADFGASIIQDTTLKSSTLNFDNQTITFDTGARFNVGVGYHFTDWLAAEVETGMAFNRTESVSGYFTDSLDYIQIPFMANAVFRLPTRSRWQPFAGVGLGGVATQLADSNFTYGQSDEDFGFAWQAFAGCRYQISSKVELGLTYRYLGTTEHDFDSFGIKMEGTHTHSFMASIVVRF